MYVSSIFDLFKHVRLHRRRVFRLGWSLRDRCKTRRGRLLLAAVLFLHDLEKYPYLGLLWRFYGEKGKGPNRKAAVRAWTAMNRLGASLLSLATWFIPHADYDWRIAKDIERLADVVDRNTDPVAMEEFCLERQRPLTDFLPRRLLLQAVYLKRDWPKLCADLLYGDRRAPRP